MSNFLPTGKIKTELLEHLLKKYGNAEDKRVIVGPGIGEDAAVIDFGERYLVAKTDPITFATEEIGWYVININANDIASMGATPKWFLATILLPENKTTESEVERIFKSISDACKGLGVALCGGHTEVTYGLERPIVVGQMLGEVSKEKLVTTSGAKEGDDILLVKGIAIEGTSIIAREKETLLKSKYSDEFINRAKKYLFDPGISVVKEASLASSLVKVNSMHDPTEGGLAMGLYEVAKASNKGMIIHGDRIPIFPESEELCRFFGLDPLGTISSGSLVITLRPIQTEKLLKIYRENSIDCKVIGKVLKEKEIFKIKIGDRCEDLTHFEKDEVIKIF